MAITLQWRNPNRRPGCCPFLPSQGQQDTYFLHAYTNCLQTSYCLQYCIRARSICTHILPAMFPYLPVAYWVIYINHLINANNQKDPLQSPNLHGAVNSRPNSRVDDKHACSMFCSQFWPLLEEIFQLDVVWRVWRRNCLGMLCGFARVQWTRASWRGLVRSLDILMVQWQPIQAWCITKSIYMVKMDLWKIAMNEGSVNVIWTFLNLGSLTFSSCPVFPLSFPYHEPLSKERNKSYDLH